MSTVWDVTGPEILIGHHLPHNRKNSPTKVAAFDLDSTLVVTKSGKFTAADPHDWDWWHSTVPAKLKQISKEGYQIVVFTNQGRLTTRNGNKSPMASLFQTKVESIFRALDVPATIYAACANDEWRKPRTRAWEHYIQTVLSGQDVDLGCSYLVGDAAGRPSDHTDADRHFSMNVGLAFFTPEEFFLNTLSESWDHKFDPSWYHPIAPGNPSFFELPQETSLIILTGLPGSGKTTFFHRNLQDLGYDRIDASTNLTEEEAINTAHGLLEARRSVVVDGWNLDCSSRELWMTVAKAHDVKVFAVHLTTTPQLCLHNDAVRALGSIQGARAVYPRLAFWDLVKSFQPPQKAEGFDRIFEIDFTWRGTAEELVVWRKFWI